MYLDLHLSDGTVVKSVNGVFGLSHISDLPLYVNGIAMDAVRTIFCIDGYNYMNGVEVLDMLIKSGDFVRNAVCVEYEQDIKVRFRQWTKLDADVLKSIAIEPIDTMSIVPRPLRNHIVGFCDNIVMMTAVWVYDWLSFMDRPMKAFNCDDKCYLVQIKDAKRFNKCKAKYKMILGV